MSLTCEYCSGLIDEGQHKCAGCGAPISRGTAVIPDFRRCPFCRRKLLALGSPACNYCGKRLPEKYIRARESDLNRITEVEGGDETEMGRKVDELIREGVRGKRGRSPLGITNIKSLIDLFR
ncbi:MAG: hypothetical protein WAV20_20875 [Blastocatellia bacterium]